MKRSITISDLFSANGLTYLITGLVCFILKFETSGLSRKLKPNALIQGRPH